MKEFDLLLEIKKKKQNNKEINSDVKVLIDYFYEQYYKKFGIEPYFNGGMVGKNFKTLLKKYDCEKLKKMVDIYLNTPKKFWQENGYSINIFLSAHTINDLQFRLKEQMKKEVYRVDEELKKRKERLKNDSNI